MSASHKNDAEGLELEDYDHPHQVRTWRAERAGWAVMLFIVLLALAGVFGAGPVSEARVDSPDARLSLTYERFTRRGLTSVLKVEFDHARAEDDTLVTVWFDREFLEGLRLQQIVPEPVESETDGDRLVFSFQRGESAARPSVTFEVVGDRIGRRAGVVGAGNGPGAPFRQIVYP